MSQSESGEVEDEYDAVDTCVLVCLPRHLAYSEVGSDVVLRVESGVFQIGCKRKRQWAHTQRAQYSRAAGGDTQVATRGPDQARQWGVKWPAKILEKLINTYVQLKNFAFI